MKIVIDARTMGSKPSGIGIYAFNYIMELVKSNHEIVLLTDVATSGEMEVMRGLGVEIISYGSVIYQSAQVFKYFDFVIKELNRLQPDLFWEPNIIIPKKLAGFKGKVMITIHDMFPISHKQYFGLKYSLYFRVMLGYTLKHTDVVLYNSNETKEETEKYFAQAKKVRGIVKYIIVPRINTSQEGFAGETPTRSGVKNAKIREKVSSQKDYFLYVGNLEKRKGVDILLEAFRQYKANGGKNRLVLAGKSREKDIDEAIDKLSRESADVVSLGYVSDEEKRHLYANCDCFLFPSRAEGFGISVLEAMNYYKPVIASDLSIFQEVVGDAVSYFKLSGDLSADSDNLCHRMLEYNMADRAVYDEVMSRYEAKTLGSQVREIFDNI